MTRAPSRCVWIVAAIASGCPPFEQLEIGEDQVRDAGPGEGEGEGECVSEPLAEPECTPDSPMTRACLDRGERTADYRYLGYLSGDARIAAAGGTLFAQLADGDVWVSRDGADLEALFDHTVVGLSLDAFASDGAWAVVQDAEGFALWRYEGLALVPVQLAAEDDVQRIHVRALDATGDLALLVAERTSAVDVAVFSTEEQSVTWTPTQLLPPGLAIARADALSAASGVRAVVLDAFGNMVVADAMAGPPVLVERTLEPADFGPGFAIALSGEDLTVVDADADGARVRVASLMGVGGNDAPRVLDERLAIEGLLFVEGLAPWVAASAADGCVAFGSANGFLAHGAGAAAAVFGVARRATVVSIDAAPDGPVWVRRSDGHVDHLSTPPCLTDGAAVNPFGAPTGEVEDALLLDEAAAPLGALHTVLWDGSILYGSQDAMSHVLPGSSASATSARLQDETAGEPRVVVAAYEDRRVDGAVQPTTLVVMSDGSLGLWTRETNLILTPTGDTRLPPEMFPPPESGIFEHGVVATFVPREDAPPGEVDVWVAGTDPGSEDGNIAIVFCTLRWTGLNIERQCGDPRYVGFRAAEVPGYRLLDIEARVACGEGIVALLGLQHLWLLELHDGADPTLRELAAGVDPPIDDNSLGRGAEIVVHDDEGWPPSLSVPLRYGGAIHTFRAGFDYAPVRTDVGPDHMFQAVYRGGTTYLGTSGVRFYALDGDELRRPSDDAVRAIGPEVVTSQIVAIAADQGRTWLMDSSGNIFMLSDAEQ